MANVGAGHVGRLQPEFLERIERFCDRVLDVAQSLAKQKHSRRIVDQMIGAGTSIGANTFEADEAMSRPDFCRCLGIAVRELNETHFWLRMTARREWVTPERLASLLQETVELKRIMGAIISNSRKTDPDTPDVS